MSSYLSLLPAQTYFVYTVDLLLLSTFQQLPSTNRRLNSVDEFVHWLCREGWAYKCWQSYSVCVSLSLRSCSEVRLSGPYLTCTVWPQGPKYCILTTTEFFQNSLDNFSIYILIDHSSLMKWTKSHKKVSDCFSGHFLLLLLLHPKDVFIFVLVLGNNISL